MNHNQALLCITAEILSHVLTLLRKLRSKSKFLVKRKISLFLPLLHYLKSKGKLDLILLLLCVVSGLFACWSLTGI